MTASRQGAPAGAEAQRTGHFHGGLRLRHHKRISCADAVERPPLPELLVVPLLQQAGDMAEPLVRPGDTVQKGQPIGRCQPGAAVHAPVSGSVLAIEDRPMSHPSGQPGPCVIIRPDGREQWCRLEPLSDWQNASPDSLIRQMQDCGLAGLGGAVFPTHAKMRDGRERKTHTLILNGVECEPWISCDEMLMREQPGKIILGARILRRALGAERVVIAVEDQMGAALQALSACSEFSESRNI